MGVFPAASSKHVPAPWAELMIDPVCIMIREMIKKMMCVYIYIYYIYRIIYLQKSHIIDFYPEDFKIDLNGKKFAWQGVALLPFVDEKRLFKALVPHYDSLTEAESEYI